jgi:hypothetical protein
MLRKRNQPPAPPSIAVKNRLVDVEDEPRAADLFRRILRSVREQTEENRRKRGGDNGGTES